MSEQKHQDADFVFSDLFVPLTSKKAIIFIVIIGIFIYFNSWFGSPIWDDTGYIFDNPQVQSINLFQDFSRNILTTNGFYRPFIPFSFSLLYALFQKQT